MQGALKSEFGTCPRCCDTIAHLEYVATVLVRGRAAKYSAVHTVHKLLARVPISFTVIHPLTRGLFCGRQITDLI